MREHQAAERQTRAVAEPREERCGGRKSEGRRLKGAREGPFSLLLFRDSAFFTSCCGLQANTHMGHGFTRACGGFASTRLQTRVTGWSMHELCSAPKQLACARLQIYRKIAKLEWLPRIGRACLGRGLIARYPHTAARPRPCCRPMPRFEGFSSDLPAGAKNRAGRCDLWGSSKNIVFCLPFFWHVLEYICNVLVACLDRISSWPKPSQL